MSLFAFVSGCELLIPKFYFDAYGGFDETFRAIQDLKKWFEMFRGKRLIHVRKALFMRRTHAEQTGRTYTLTGSESIWLYSWMIYNLHKDDIVGSGLTDLYHLHSALFTRSSHMSWWRPPYDVNAIVRKLMELPESPDADVRAQRLNATINDGNFETYLPKEEQDTILFDFSLRGVSLGGNVKFISFNQFASVKPASNVRLLNRDALLQALIDTPIRKQIFVEWLQRTQGGNRA